MSKPNYDKVLIKQVKDVYNELAESLAYDSKILMSVNANFGNGLNTLEYSYYDINKKEVLCTIVRLD